LCQEDYIYHDEIMGKKLFLISFPFLFGIIIMASNICWSEEPVTLVCYTNETSRVGSMWKVFCRSAEKGNIDLLKQVFEGMQGQISIGLDEVYDSVRCSDGEFDPLLETAVIHGRVDFVYDFLEYAMEQELIMGKEKFYFVNLILNTADAPFQNFAEFLQDSLRSSDETKDNVPYKQRMDLEKFITSPESLHKMYEKVKSRYEKEKEI